MFSNDSIPAEILADIVDLLPVASATRLMRVSRRSHAIVKRCFDSQHRRKVGPVHWLGGIRLTSTDSSGSTTVQVRSCNSFTQPAPFQIDGGKTVEQLRPLMGYPVRVQDLCLDADDASSYRQWTEAISHYRHAFPKLHYVSLSTGDDSAEGTSAVADLLDTLSEIAAPLSVDLKFRRAFAGDLLSKTFVRSRAYVSIDCGDGATLTEADVNQIVDLLHSDAEVIPMNSDHSLLREVTLVALAIPVQHLLQRLVTKFTDADTASEYKLHVKLSGASGVMTATTVIYRNRLTREVLDVEARLESGSAELIVIRRKKRMYIF